MNTRKLGTIEVSEIGYGCMGFSHGYGALPPKEDAILSFTETVRMRTLQS